MRYVLVQPDQQTAIVRNRKAWLDTLELTRTKEEAIRADEQSVTKLWWQMIPNVADARVAIMIEQETGNPLLTSEETAALVTEEQAKADGFYHPDPTVPVIVALSPANNATEVDGTANLIATFDALPTFGVGSVHLYDGANQHVASLTAPGHVGTGGGSMHIAGNELIIDLANTMRDGERYYVLMDETLINGFAGISDKLMWNWKIALAPVATAAKANKAPAKKKTPTKRGRR